VWSELWEARGEVGLGDWAQVCEAVNPPSTSANAHEKHQEEKLSTLAVGTRRGVEEVGGLKIGSFMKSRKPQRRLREET
jgi:hypothetical protein